MEKSKRSKPEPEGQVDRLSELPNSLIFRIFSFMAMTDVVKTTILSSRWKDLWTTAPTLNFKDFQMVAETDVFLKRVKNFIKRVLIFWRGARIESFVIDCDTHFNKSIHSDIDLCLHFATKYQVERLRVCLGACDSSQAELYWAPQCLYSCSSLKSLHLDTCNFRIPIKNVNWNQLKYLCLDGYGLSDDLINKVLSGSPQLKVFILYLVENTDNLTIESTSLKHLFVDKYYDADIPSVDTELRISTPNLEVLELSGVPYRKFWMNNVHVPSLSHVNLMFDGPTQYSHLWLSENDFVGEILQQLLPTIQHVEKLELSDWCIKALRNMNNKNLLSPFTNVKQLWLDGCFEEYEEIVRLLENFPELELLDLEEKCSKKYHEKQHQHGCREFEANVPNSFLQKLRTVVITWAEGEESTLLLTQILLKYASKLKKMVFQSTETAPPRNSLLMALLRMPRSSSTAEVFFSTIPDLEVRKK